MNFEVFMDNHPDNDRLVDAYRDYRDVKESFCEYQKACSYVNLLDFFRLSFTESDDRFHSGLIINAINHEINILNSYANQILRTRDRFYNELTAAKGNDLPFE